MRVQQGGKEKEGSGYCLRIGKERESANCSIVEKGDN